MNKAIKFALAVLAVSALVALLVIGWAWQSVPWYPPVSEAEVSCQQPVPPWDGQRPLKVLSYNVQYMASKNYVFFYDVEGGPDTQPSLEHTRWTLDRVADIIRDEQPDVLMLQEINDQYDSRTHHVDQLAQLQRRLAEQAFPCQASAYYWKAGLVLHPSVLGSVSMKLITLSRYPLTSARRHQLPLMDKDPLTQRFYFQRAILEAHMATADGAEVALLNTHYDAWGEGSDLMNRQVGVSLKLLESLDQRQIPWLFGGDLNLLPDDNGRQWRRLSQYFDEQTALKPLYDRYGAIPAKPDLLGADAAHWLTHYPNDPAVTGPDRTIDYLFYSDQWQLLRAYVRQHDTLDVSDHLPVVGLFGLSPAPALLDQQKIGQ